MNDNYRIRSGFWLVFTVCAAFLLLPGCATVFSDSFANMTFSSDVDEVRIFIDGRLVGKTPLKIKVDSKMGAKGPTLKAEKEGFKTQEFILQKKFNNVAIWNSTFIFSWGTDLLTGALFQYEPKKYHIELVPDNKTAASREFYRKRLAYRFIVVNYDNIMRDLSRGDGEYVHNLANVLVDNNGDRAEFSALLGRDRRLLLMSESRFDFVHAINQALSRNARLNKYIL